MYKTTRGFTLIEIIITVSILGILAMIGAASYSNIQRDSRDQRRANAITIIGESLESYYDKNGEYLDCDNASDEPLTSLKNSGILNDDSVLIAPKNDTVSLSCSEPSITDDYYQYDGNKYSWKLRYFSEAKGQIIEELTSRRGSIIISNPNLPNLNTMVLMTSDITTSSVRITWNEIVNASKYFIQYSTDDNFPNGDTTKTQFINNPKTTEYELADLDSDTEYYVRAKAIGDGVSYNNGDYSDVINATTMVGAITIATPEMTDITATVEGNSTRWSWEEVTCQDNTTIEYEYKFQTLEGGLLEEYRSPSYSYEHGWPIYILEPENAPTSYRRTTMELGETYTLTIHARCVDNNDEDNHSGWSDEKSASYIREMPIVPNPTISVNQDPADDNYTIWSWEPVNECNFISGYSTRYYYQWGTNLIGFIDWTTGDGENYTLPTTTSYRRLTSYLDYTYTLRVRAVCEKAGSPDIGNTSENLYSSADYYRPAKLPATPEVTISKINDTYTTWSWPAITCEGMHNYTVSYEYRYTTSSGHDSGWKDGSEADRLYDLPTANSYKRDTHWLEFEYNLKVRAVCSRPGVKQMKSFIGSDSHYRPVPPPDAPTISLTASSLLRTAVWKWNDVACKGEGYSLSYLYKFAIESDDLDRNYNSNWKDIRGDITGGTWINNSYTRTLFTADRYQILSLIAVCKKGQNTLESPPASKTWERIIPSEYTIKLTAKTGGSVSGAGTFPINSSNTITATVNNGYTFDKWTGSSGCSGNKNTTVTINLNGDKTCTAWFDVNTPAVPTVSASTSGNNTTYSWSGSTCPAGSTIEYRYKQYPKYWSNNQWVPLEDRSWTTTTNTSYVADTSYQGFYHSAYVQARCKISLSSKSSEWSQSGEGYYLRYIQAPVGTPSYDIWVFNTSKYRVNFKIEMPSNACASYNDLFTKYDIYSGTQYWRIGSYKTGWLSTVTYPELLDMHSYKYRGNLIETYSDRILNNGTYGTQATNEIYALRSTYKCINAYTGMESSATTEYGSGNRAVGAYR